VNYLDPPVNPYDPAVPNLEPQTLPPDEIIRRAVRDGALALKVCIPASVTKINGDQNVDVQPLFKSRLITGEVKIIPPVQQVPVSMMMGNDFSVRLPVAVGDTGYLIIADRNMDAWLAGSGGIVDPLDSRSHNLTDAIFVPGLVPMGKQTKIGGTDLVITNGKLVAKFQKAGTFVVTNGANELLDLLVQITNECQSLSQTLSTDTVNTMLGPQKLNAFSTYANIANVLEDLLNKLTTLKGA